MSIIKCTTILNNETNVAKHKNIVFVVYYIFLAQYNFHEMKTHSRYNYLSTMIDVAEGRLYDPAINDFLC